MSSWKSPNSAWWQSLQRDPCNDDAEGIEKLVGKDALSVTGHVITLTPISN